MNFESLLSQFDNQFVPSDSNAEGVAALPDGKYILHIKGTKLASVTIKATGVTVPIVRWDYRIEPGSQSCVGAEFEHATWLKDQKAANLLGAELLLIGIPTDTWGTRFSQELPKVLPTLPGVTVVATKESWEWQGKKVHALRWESKAAAFTPPPTMEGAPGDDLPF